MVSISLITLKLIQYLNAIFNGFGMGNSTAGPAFRMGGPAFRTTECRHSERPNAAIPKSRHSERPLFRNSAIPKLTIKAILSMSSASIPYIQHIKWKMRISSTPSNNVFIIFLPIMYSFTQKKNVIPRGVIIPLYSTVGRSSHKSEISGYWDTSKFIQERIHTIVSNVGRRLVDSGLKIVLFTHKSMKFWFIWGSSKTPLYQLKDLNIFYSTISTNVGLE